MPEYIATVIVTEKHRHSLKVEAASLAEAHDAAIEKLKAGGGNEDGGVLHILDYHVTGCSKVQGK